MHAVQDQWVDLDALTDPELGNDRATAAQAAIEGHATLVMLEYMTEQMQGAPVDVAALPNFASLLRSQLDKTPRVLWRLTVLGDERPEATTLVETLSARLGGSGRFVELRRGPLRVGSRVIRAGRGISAAELTGSGSVPGSER